MSKFLAIVFLFLIFNVNGLAGEYVVDREAENEVKFISEAIWENFEGVTGFIDGYVYWDGEKLTNKSELYFEVELNTVETGNGKRDRDMREDYLHTNRFPYTHYTGKIVDVKDSTDSILKISTDGVMFIHGVERKLTVNALMTKNEEGYQVKSNFIIKLSDYNIKIPQLMIFKINEEMQLQLTFYVKKI
ncbi:MAG: YceI family protein [Calditrichaeota bacterium]|nr:YceI family protein [Calditrichota bacterium]